MSDTLKTVSIMEVLASILEKVNEIPVGQEPRVELVDLAFACFGITTAIMEKKVMVEGQLVSYEQLLDGFLEERNELD